MLRRLLTVLVIVMYAVFAYQLSGLWRRGRYGQFFLRLLLAPVILLFDWPVHRSHWKDKM